MSINLREYAELKEKADNLQRESDRSAGVLEELMRRLKKDFGICSVKDAKKLYMRLEQEAIDLEEEYQKATVEFKKSHGDKMGDVE